MNLFENFTLNLGGDVTLLILNEFVKISRKIDYVGYLEINEIKIFSIYMWPT